MSLITVTQLEERYGAVDEARAQAHIDDISAEIVDYVNILDTDSDNPIDADEWTPNTTPQAIIGVTARAVNRALSNPFGVTQEALGDHSITFTSGASGGTLSPKDKRIIRRAIGRLGINTVQLEGYLPVEPDLTELDV